MKLALFLGWAGFFPAKVFLGGNQHNKKPRRRQSRQDFLHPGDLRGCEVFD
jgi:hypothetical protein